MRDAILDALQHGRAVGHAELFAALPDDAKGDPRLVSAAKGAMLEHLADLVREGKVSLTGARADRRWALVKERVAPATGHVYLPQEEALARLQDAYLAVIDDTPRAPAEIWLRIPAELKLAFFHWTDCVDEAEVFQRLVARGLVEFAGHPSSPTIRRCQVVAKAEPPKQAAAQLTLFGEGAP